MYQMSHMALRLVMEVVQEQEQLEEGMAQVLSLLAAAVDKGKITSYGKDSGQLLQFLCLKVLV